MQAADDISQEYARLRVRLGLVPASEQPLIDGRYRIEQTLGRGAMGVVYRVWDERLRRRVALKVVRQAPGISIARMQARLEREALALAKIDHPNVVQVYDVGAHEGSTYVAMQYVPGKTLRHWQTESGRTQAELLDAYLQAARGLAAAHAGKLVHRDFKPDNVLVGDDGIVRVADFGIAAALAGDEQLDTVDTAAEASQRASKHASEGTLDSRTATGTLLGTAPYMAPEQLAGVRATARSDQFGFCVALVEALSGSRPFVGNTRAQLIDSIGRGLPRALVLPSALRAILRRGLAREVEARFETMDALVAALEHTRARRRRLIVAAPLSLALVAALALGSWLGEGDAPASASPGEQRCATLDARVDALWSPARRAELDALAALDPAMHAYVTRTIDQQVARWRASLDSRCGAAASPSPRDEACHDAWLDALDRSLALLGHADATMLERAPELLARLVPPQGNYCALAPDPLVDPQVAEQAASLREAAEFGDFVRAEQIAAAALPSGDDSGFAAERAELLEARGELHLLAGRVDAAAQDFARAHAHALATGHRRVLLDVALWRAHAAVTPGRPGTPELAALYLEEAEPLAHALELGPDDPHRGELELVRGLVAQHRGELDAARAHDLRAKQLFERGEQPIRAARALINLGTLELEQGAFAAGHAAFEQAARVLDGAAVPERHRLRLRIDYHLGLIAYAQSELGGLAPLDRVARLDGDPLTRLRALNLALALAFDVGTLEQARAWAERTRAELARTRSSGSEVPEDLALELATSLAYVALEAGEPGAEAELDALELRAAGFDAELHVNLRCSRIDWLEEHERCAEAATRLAALDAHVATLEHDFHERVYAPWRADKPATTCPSE
jgi:tRNA A-37 threonylcarbamoyl transferase component Bud32/tetratricopeptide (TPR) repeat protein